MPFDAPSTRPNRMAIVNLATAEEVQLQYNPAEIEEVLGVNYARQTSPGLSHQVLQFIHTENLTLSFELTFDALTNPGEYTAEDALKARAFIHSLCYPRDGAASVRDGAPPRVLMIWPYLYTLSTVITKARFKFIRFFRSGKPSAFNCNLTIEEIRDFRTTSEEVLQYGTTDGGGSVPDRGFF